MPFFGYFVCLLDRAHYRFVLTDRSYKAEVSYLPDCFDNNDFTKKQVKEFTGTLSETDYSILCAIMMKNGLIPQQTVMSVTKRPGRLKCIIHQAERKKQRHTRIYLSPANRKARRDSQ